MTNFENTTKSEEILTPSNIITISRIFLVPVFVAVLLAPWPEWFGPQASMLNEWKPFIAAGVFILISLTDWLDGYLARSRSEITDFGKFLDPLADKILVAAALISLVELGSLPTWVVLVILSREFIVSGLRMVAASKGIVVAASMLGKFKTVFSMIAIVLFTIKDSHMIGSFGEAITDGLWVLSWIIMLIALGLTVASMIDYLITFRSIIGFAPGASQKSSSDKACKDTTETPSGAQLDASIRSYAHKLVEKATKKKITFASAESLTGGMIGEYFTSIPGASLVFEGGVISYTNKIKSKVLQVDSQVLAQDGAVCEQVVQEMACGVRSLMSVDYALAVSGIAGPGGGSKATPLGTVWIAVSHSSADKMQEFHFEGSREAIRKQTVLSALLLLDAFIDETLS